VRLGAVEICLGTGWIPQICTLFFALHHMAGPLGFVQRLREGPEANG
jgi:hypothetical protein